MRSVLLSLCLLASSSAFAADPANPTATDPKRAEMMKKFEEYAKPGAPHKLLEGMAGNWNYTSKMWESRTAKPEEAKGTSSFKMILGGRFLQQEIKGKAMGMPFDGVGLVGYDNMKKKYETTWMDSMSTGTMRGEGSFNESTKTLSDAGEYSCPITNKQRSYRSEWKITDKNNMTFAMFGPGMEDPAEFKMMEITYKRK